MSAGKPASDYTRRLMRVIATLSDERDVFSKDGRELTAHLAADETPLDVLLQEISETVLHRMLVFTSTRFGSIRLEVAERRVLRVEKPADAYAQVIALAPGQPLIQVAHGVVLWQNDEQEAA